MSVYRVFIEAEYLVEIDENNAQIDGPASLQGDSEVVAVHRVHWALFRQDILRQRKRIPEETPDKIPLIDRSLGIKKILIRQHPSKTRVEKKSP